MVRTKNAGDRNEVRDRQESEQQFRNKGKALVVGGPSNYLSSDAQRRFDEAIAKKKIFIAERGIPRVSEVDPYCWFSRMANNLGWANFCEPREPAVIPVVREFYAQVPEHRDGKIRLRGKTVRFTADTINGIFDLPIPDVDEYERFAESSLTEVQAELIRQELTQGKGRWETTNGEFVSFKRKHLRDQAKAWYYYIVFSMMPVTHHNLCRREPALLLYAILQNMQINVGKIIFKGILCSSEITKGYWFPSLITMLCRHARVPISENEETLRPGTLMNTTYINKLCSMQDAGELRRHRALENEAEAEPLEFDAPVDQLMPNERDIPDTQVPAASGNEILQLLHQFQRENRQTRREFRLRHEQIDENLRRNDANMQFYWSAAGYDLSQFQSMTPWADSSQAAQWNEENEENEEDDGNERHESSAED